MEQFLTLKQILLKLGMKPEELSNHESDLYVKKNEISTKFMEDYQFKTMVHVFHSQIDHTPWYDIPFGYMPEHYKSRGLNHGKELYY